MTTPTSDKLQKLQQMLEMEPRDAFLLYGMGMEYKKLTDYARAIEHFDRVIEADPNYCYAYFQRGQAHELLGQSEAASASYRAGIEAAERARDAHAKEELTAALEMLEAG
jgi:tetratricopeptide (TPR) repeat protein